jgi:DNA polymerase-4
MASATRKIIHVDMDAFYASVEQRDDPTLCGRPVIVGGDPRGRGVVAAASYEARALGIRSAMPCAEAHRLARDAVFLRPRFDVYRDVSLKIRAIFREYTPLVEPISLDEAFLDVTRSPSEFQTATEIAWQIKARIFERLGLRASAGVAPTKLIAKIASDFDKPDGFVVVKPHQVEAFLRDLPIERLWGVGASTATRIHRMGIETIGELRRIPRASLEKQLGNMGRVLHGLSRGDDPRPVTPHRIARSRSAEETFTEDMRDIPAMQGVLDQLSERVSRALIKLGNPGRTIILKVRYSDFQTITRSQTLSNPTWDADVIAHTARELLARCATDERPVRLLGVGTSNLLSIRDSPQEQFAFMEAASSAPDFAKTPEEPYPRHDINGHFDAQPQREHSQ